MLNGLKILITSGPTQEPLDPVRHLTNHSSGKQGHYIAAGLAAHGAEVTLVSGPVQIPDPAGVKMFHVKQATEMLEVCLSVLQGNIDVAICTAAVSDWRFKEISPQKLKKQVEIEVMHVTLIKNPDILAAISQHPTLRPKLVIGFAAETEQVIPHALAKRQQKQCDWIIANDVTSNVFGTEENTVCLIREGEVDPWPTMSKHAVAERLAKEIAVFFER